VPEKPLTVSMTTDFPFKRDGWAPSFHREINDHTFDVWAHVMLNRWTPTHTYNYRSITQK
jgi:hypothetical protein